jgi:hypothetical protein
LSFSAPAAGLQHRIVPADRPIPGRPSGFGQDASRQRTLRPGSPSDPK